ncbi:MAG: hypothetical protein ABI779_09080 [Acidobacteriota bacterium]
MSTPSVIGRREFLVASSATLVAAATLGPSLFAGASASSLRSLAVGFANSAEKSRLVDASTISSGDGGFIGAGARIAVSGSSGTSGAARDRRAVQLLTNFAYFEGATLRMAPFQAWGASRVTGGQGSPVRFTIPVDLTQSISLTVVVESGDTSPSAPTSRRRAMGSPGGAGSPGVTSLPLVLSVKGDSSAISLVRGFYVVAPLFEGDRAPDWSQYRLFQVDGRWALIDEAGGLAPFEHVVLNISYAVA